MRIISNAIIALCLMGMGMSNNLLSVATFLSLILAVVIINWIGSLFEEVGEQNISRSDQFYGDYK